MFLNMTNGMNVKKEKNKADAFCVSGSEGVCAK